MDDVHDLLSSILGVVRLVHQFPILPSSTVRDVVQVDSFFLSCVKSSVMKTTAAMSPVGIM